MLFRSRAWYVFVKVDKGGGCEGKKANEEDREAEEVGGFVGGAGHRGGHDGGGGGGGRRADSLTALSPFTICSSGQASSVTHGRGRGIIWGGPGGTSDTECAYLFDRKRTNCSERRGATFIPVHNRKS